MLVKYKTILYGEKPAYKDIDEKDVFKPNKAEKYKVISCDFCCDTMKEYIKGNGDWYFCDWDFPKPSYFVSIPNGYGNSYHREVTYCLFCGKKVGYKEVEKVRLKKIEGIDYIEEDCK